MNNESESRPAPPGKSDQQRLDRGYQPVDGGADELGYQPQLQGSQQTGDSKPPKGGSAIEPPASSGTEQK